MNEPACSPGHGADRRPPSEVAGNGPHRTAHDRSRDGPSGRPFGGFGPGLGLDVIFRQAVAFSDILPGLVLPYGFQMLVGIENRAALGRTSHEKQKKKHPRQSCWRPSFFCQTAGHRSLLSC
jgi:hypothetical protein